MREVFDLLLRIQNRQALPLLVIGGWAVQAHGYTRATLDVDCLTAVGNDAVLAAELEKSGFVCFDEKSSFRRFQHKLDPLLVLDVMRVNEATFEKMWALSEPYFISGIELRVPALAHLIALKLHAARNEHRTDKDLADVRELLRANPEKVPPEDLLKLCRQFGSPEQEEYLKDYL